jgi:hypothetical protein
MHREVIASVEHPSAAPRSRPDSATTKRAAQHTPGLDAEFHKHIAAGRLAGDRGALCEVVGSAGPPATPTARGS